MSADGQTALIGTPFDDTDAGEDAGEAYVFTRTETGWDTTAPAVLQNPDSDESDFFGRSVALSADGQTALVGAPRHSTDAGEYVGEAYLFSRTEAGRERDNSITLPNPDPDPGDQFGEAVSLTADGTTALIGAPEPVFRQIGEAYIFDRTAAGWETTNPVALPYPTNTSPAQFGEAVTLSADGTTALVGAPGTPGEHQDLVGTAFVFTRTEAGWETTDPVRLPNPDPFGDDEFGSDVALNTDGTTTLISVPGGHGTKGVRAYVFRRTEFGWDTTDPVVFPEPDSFSEDGSRAVALSADGETALLGTPNKRTETGGTVGEAYVFRRTEARWDTTDPITLSDPTPEDENGGFGWSVSLNAEGTSALVGAPSDDTEAGENGGEAYLFERSKPSLVFKDQMSSGDTVTITSVTMPEGGFVVVASADGDTIYGVSEYLPSGPTTDLRITLDTPLPEDGTYLASGQADTNGDRRYDAPRTLDVCQLDADGSSLLDTAEITLRGDTL